jgi:hypothetical protein
MGLKGWATIERVSACPPLKPGAGRVMLSTYESLSASVLRLTFHGGAAVECTAGHPFYSEDRQKYIAAWELAPGDRVRTQRGTVALRERHETGRWATVFNAQVEAKASET